MRFIQFDAFAQDIIITEHQIDGGVNIRVGEVDITTDNPYQSRIPVASYIYKDVIYAARYAEDKRNGLKVEYFLAPPDPWLVALGLVMWDGIIQGMTWDAVKAIAHRALAKMQNAGVAPKSGDQKITQKESVELGFCWIKYVEGDKQHEMFIGLRKAFHREQKLLKKPKAQPRKKSQ